MKLLFCPVCTDVRKLRYSNTSCECGASYGSYMDDLNANVGGRAVLLGLHNGELVKALKRKKHVAYSKADQFTAWVIAEPCKTVRRMKS